MSSYEILYSTSTNIWYNLALEEMLFREVMPQQYPYRMLLYVNSAAVVMGHFQNPWLECRPRYLANNNIKLARRFSGGGTVYHDLGNLNFSFMSDKACFNVKSHFKIILNALEKLGIQAEVTCRNDIIINDDGPLKFSGSAFKNILGRSLHHGTLLINSDLNSLADGIFIKKQSIEAKGIKSKRAKVTNLSDFSSQIDMIKMKNQLAESFRSFFSSQVEIKTIKEEEILQNSAAMEIVTRLKSNEWVLGKTPFFKINLDFEESFGSMQLKLEVQYGAIIAVDIECDFLHEDLIKNIILDLYKKKYSAESIYTVFVHYQEELPLLAEDLQAIWQWLQLEIL